MPSDLDFRFEISDCEAFIGMDKVEALDEGTWRSTITFDHFVESKPKEPFYRVPSFNQLATKRVANNVI